MKADTRKALRYGSRSLGRILGWFFKITGTLILIIVTSGVMLAIIGVNYVNQNLKSDLTVDFKDFELAQTSTIYCFDAQGNRLELETLYARENRVMATYDEVPRHMINALIAVEDKRFYSHSGVDWWRTIGAFSNLFTGDQGQYGGSTITQQLIKNITGNKEVTIDRKLSEIYMALESEKHYTKREIILLYLNTCYFGQSCYGVKTAARTYFNEELSKLTLAQSACIIGITNAPTRYDPFNNPEKNKKRQEVILKLMYEQEMITEAEYEKALVEKLVFVKGNRPSERGTQSFFVEQVYLDVAAALAEDRGITLDLAKQLVLNGGLQIDATIDLEIQAHIDEIFENEENIPTVRSIDPPQAAMILMDPYTGAVLGMAGGVGEKEGNLLHNRAVKTVRQPGSAIKPIGAYAPALENGLITPYSIIDDSPFRLSEGDRWPNNADRRYRGLMTVLEGITRSVNTIAARTVDMVSVEESFRFLQEEFGVTSLKPEDMDHAPLALGGLNRGISVLDITAAYCTFPNQGEYIKPRTFSQVRDSKGTVILDNPPQGKQILQKKNAWYMNTMLYNVVNGAGGTGGRARLNSGIPVAGKTGTTTKDRDRWFVGYTPYFCAGVWFGFDTPKKIELDISENPALNLWKQVMDRLHEDEAIMERVRQVYERDTFFTMEEGETVSASYCLDSGKKPTEACRSDIRGSRVATGVFYKDDVPTESCDVHVTVNVCSETGKLATPYCPATRSVSLLNFARNMPTPGVVVGDEGYRVRYYSEGGLGSRGDVAPGFYAPADPGGDAPNWFCGVHTEYWTPPPPDPPPGDDPQPGDAPVDPQ